MYLKTKMNNNSLIIFDFDDTVVDNSTLDYMGFKIPCQKLGMRVPTKSKLIMYRKKGMLAKEIIQIFSNDQEKLKEFLKLRKIFLKNESFTYLKVKPYSTLVFKKLIKNNKLIISTANNNPKMINKFLKENNLDKFFKKIFSINDLGIKLENDNFSNRIIIKTSLLRLISKNYKNSITHFIFIGNSLEDYHAAKKLKIKFIYFSNTYLQNPKINNLIKITNMKQIPNLIMEEKN